MYNKNDIIDIEITGLTSEGEGIGRSDGFPFFVKGAIPGDVIRAGITKLKKTYAYARLIELLKPSGDRCEPLCPAFGRCGGCRLMHMKYEAQAKYKEEKIIDTLSRIGGMDREKLEELNEGFISAVSPLRYRNKAQYPFGKDKNGDIVFGFFESRSHRIVPCGDCLLGGVEDGKLLLLLKDWMEENGIEPYDEQSGKGFIRHALIRRSRENGDMMLCLVINGKKLPAADALIERLAGIPSVKSVMISINTKNTNVIMGEECRLIWGEPGIRDSLRLLDGKDFSEISGVKREFFISPLSFYQVNPEQTERLYATAVSYAGLSGNETVWDLYCGIGTISLMMAANAKEVIGVEIVPQAIADAKENARFNGVKNVRFIVGAAEEVVTDESLPRPQVVVVDPPRKGCDRICLDTILKLSPDRIVYVSCDPATLARDLSILRSGGYELKRFRGCDMFAQSHHVETVCLLSNRKPDTKVRIDVDLEDYYRIKDSKKNQN